MRVNSEAVLPVGGGMGKQGEARVNKLLSANKEGAFSGEECGSAGQSEVT